eukprot:3315269-Prymnesium_polylepis.1
MDAEMLRRTTQRWVARILEVAFYPPDSNGVRQPTSSWTAKRLITSTELLTKVATNALKRILKCIAPPDVEAYTLTGETDQNGIEIWKSELHTCGVESLNSAQLDFISGHSTTKEFSNGCMLQGNAKRIISQQVALGEHEDLGTWDTRAAHRINLGGPQQRRQHDPASRSRSSRGNDVAAVERALHPED